MVESDIVIFGVAEAGVKEPKHIINLPFVAEVEFDIEIADDVAASSSPFIMSALIGATPKVVEILFAIEPSGNVKTVSPTGAVGIKMLPYKL